MHFRKHYETPRAAILFALVYILFDPVSAFQLAPQTRLHAPSSRSVFRASIVASAETRTATYDWSFLDAVYLITCPNADPGLERLSKTKQILSDVNLLDKAIIREFDTDDEDRIRGCYTSHISVLKEALRNADVSYSKQMPFQQLFQKILPSEPRNNPSATRDVNILIVEDNLALSGSLEQRTIDKVADYVASGTSWDVMHLSYIPYVPNLSVSRTENDGVVQLTCGIGSALGTTAYIINGKGMKRVVKQDEENGFYAPIPDVMAELFPESRYAALPTPFVRAPNVKSLVNPQLDDLREVLFQPFVASQVQTLLATTGLSTNMLLPITIVSLLISSVLSGKSSLDAAWSFATTGSYDGPIALVLLSTLFALFSLALIAQGIFLAPKPPETAPSLDDQRS